MSIAENIIGSMAIGAEISAKKDLKEYFEDAGFNEELWPLDFEKDGIQTKYLRAHVRPDKFGISQEIDLDTVFLVENSRYVLSESISADDNLEIEIKSIIRQGAKKENNAGFVYDLLNRHERFIKNYAAENDIDPKEVKVKVHAHSGEVNGEETIGGYVWANYGFEFSSERELKIARVAFQRFAKSHNVQIEDKDLKYFKHPCHFAAFDIGENIEGNSLGKAFLLQYEWFGERRGDMTEKSEVLRYQKAYHEKGKEAAKAELSKDFLAVLHKYSHKNEQQENILNKILLMKNRLLRS